MDSMMRQLLRETGCKSIYQYLGTVYVQILRRTNLSCPRAEQKIMDLWKRAAVKQGTQTFWHHEFCLFAQGCGGSRSGRAHEARALYHLYTF